MSGIGGDWPLGAWSDVLGDARVEASPTAHDTVVQVVAGDGARFALKRLLDLPGHGGHRRRTAAQYRILLHLRMSGVPVAVPVTTDDGCIFAGSADSLYSLSPMLASDHVAPELRPDPALIYRRIGTAIGALHQALATCRYQIPSWTIDLAAQTREQTAPVLRDKCSELRISPGNLEQLSDELATTLPDLPAQRVHGDCHLGNVLLTGSQVSGFIDLDHLPIGPRIYDLAYHLGGRAAWVAADVGQREKLFLDVVGQFAAGYHEVAALGEDEWSAIVPAMLAVQLMLVAWHVRHRNAELRDKELAGYHWIESRRTEIEQQLQRTH